MVAAFAGQVENDATETGLRELCLHNVLTVSCVVCFLIWGVFICFHLYQPEKEENLTEK
jgi:hypothetical protein